MSFARSLALLAVLAPASLLAACGGASDEQLVRDTVTAFGVASAKKDYQRICDDLVAKDLAESVEAVGLPCELAFKRGLEAVKQPRLTIEKVTINKSRALVDVRSNAKGQPPSRDAIELRLEGGRWRIASLAKPQPQPPSKPAR